MAAEHELWFGGCRVRVNIDERGRVNMSAGAAMTPAEARQLAAALIETAEEVERGEG